MMQPLCDAEIGFLLETLKNGLLPSFEDGPCTVATTSNVPSPALSREAVWIQVGIVWKVVEVSDAEAAIVRREYGKIMNSEVS
jgi:hypothetical protein